VNESGTMHLDELAELYALGALPDAERAAVDAHIARCETCARRVGEAEETVAALSTAEMKVSPRLDRRMRALLTTRSSVRFFYPLVAAALILGLLPSAAFWQRDRDLHAADAARGQALAAMVNSHFLHAQFVKIAPDAPAAKVIFARSGAWFYVIALSDRNLSLSANGRSLGVLTGSGGERTLFVAHPPAAKEIVLMDGSRAVARAAVAMR